MLSRSARGRSGSRADDIPSGGEWKFGTEDGCGGERDFSPHFDAPPVPFRPEPESVGRFGQIVSHPAATRPQRGDDRAAVGLLSAGYFLDQDMHVHGAEKISIREDDFPQRTERIGMAVCVRPADGRNAPAFREQPVPPGERFRVRTADPEGREERVENHRQGIAHERFKLAHVVPDFQPGEPAHVPGNPAEGIFVDQGRGGIERVGQKRRSAGSVHRVEELLRIARQRAEVGGYPEREQVILLRDAVLLVDLLARLQQHPAEAGKLEPAVHPAHQHVVIGDEKKIQAGFARFGGDFRVIQCAV